MDKLETLFAEQAAFNASINKTRHLEDVTDDEWVQKFALALRAVQHDEIALPAFPVRPMHDAAELQRRNSLPRLFLRLPHGGAGEALSALDVSAGEDQPVPLPFFALFDGDEVRSFLLHHHHDGEFGLFGAAHSAFLRAISPAIWCTAMSICFQFAPP